MVTAKDAARRIREHNKIHQRAEPRNSPIITEILEVAAVLFEKIGEGEYQPVRHGRWIKINPYHYKCSSCGATVWIKFYPLDEHKFCWHCGAKMDGGEDNDTD